MEWLESDREEGGSRGKRQSERDERDVAGVAGRAPTACSAYIMQMVPIISEVYNRSINLLTGRKGSGRVAASQLAGVVRPPPPMLRRAR